MYALSLKLLVTDVNRIHSTELPPYNQKDEEMVKELSIYIENIGY